MENQRPVAVQFVESISISPPVVEQPKNQLSAVIDPKRYKWSALIRVTATVRRFCENLLAKRKEEDRKTGCITTPELLAAELLWIKSEQETYLPVELAYLQSGKSSRPPLVSQLDLFQDKENVVRCSGRLRYAHLSQGTKHPIFIPKQSFLTPLIIRCGYHER
jgi:hypothetical protein